MELSWWDRCPCERRQERSSSIFPSRQGPAPRKGRGHDGDRAASAEAGSGPPQEADLPEGWAPDSSASRTMRNECLLAKHPHRWCSVVGAQTDGRHGHKE